MINSFSGNNILVPVHFLIFKGVDYNELMELVNLNKDLCPNLRHFEMINLHTGPEIFYKSIPEEFLSRHALPHLGDLRGALELYFNVLPESPTVFGSEKDRIKRLITDSIVSAYKYEWPGYAERYFEFTHRLDKIEYYAKKSAVFNVCKKYRESYGVQIKEIYKAFLPFAKSFLKSISLSRFYKIFEAPEMGKEMVHKALGKIKEDKNFIADAKTIAFDEYTDRNKKFPEILVTVNQFLTDHGYCEISIHALRRYFAKPEIINLAIQARYKGDIDTLTGFFPYLDRLRCTKRNMQWQLDADTIPLFAHEGKKKYTGKYYLVVDNCSGDPIGFSYCRSENAISAVEALRMAVYNTGCLPYELLTDNAPCYEDDAFKTVITLMKFYGCRHRQARIKNGNDKTCVEGSFRSIHAVWRGVSAYKGHRVKARRPDSHPGDEYKIKAKKAQYVYDPASLAAILPEVILKYRNHSFSGKQSTKQLYDASESPEDRVMEQWKVAKLFWHTQEMTVRGNRIVFNYKGQEYKFRIMDTKLGLRVNGGGKGHVGKVTGRFNHLEPERLMIFDLRTDVFIGELTAHQSIHTLEEDMTEFDQAEFESYNGKLSRMHREVDEMLATKKGEVSEVLKRTGFKRRSRKLVQDPTRVEGLEEYLKLNNLFDQPQVRKDQIFVTETDKVSQNKESVNVKFNPIQIIEEYESIQS